jgi:L-ascorbate metabolism protein UlaG (beta-lactamase superfamily)
MFALKTLLLALVLSHCSNSEVPRADPVPQPLSAGFNVTYIANEGVLISSGQKQVLIDGLHREYKPDYAFPPPTLLSTLEGARAPYDKIDLVLVSHLHGDHFHGESVGLHLKNNPKATLVSSAQIVDGVKKQFAGFQEIESRVKQVTPEWKTQSEFKTDGISVNILGLRHGSANFSWIQNLGHVIEIGGKKLLHIGDADMTVENFSSFRLHEKGIDIAFIPYWYLLSENGRQLVKEQFAAKHIIAVHVSPKDAKEVTEQIKKTNPDATVFTKTLESKSF